MAWPSPRLFSRHAAVHKSAARAARPKPLTFVCAMIQPGRCLLCSIAIIALIAAKPATRAGATDNATGQPAPDAGRVESGSEAFFESKIRPLLAERCQKCHGAEKQEAGLRLDRREAALKGGDSGPIVAPGEPDKSRLIEVVRYDGDTQMPPSGKLPDDELALLVAWVKQGAPWPADGGEPARASSMDMSVSRLENA